MVEQDEDTLNLDCEHIEYDSVHDIWYCKEIGEVITVECNICGEEDMKEEVKSRPLWWWEEDVME